MNNDSEAATQTQYIVHFTSFIINYSLLANIRINRIHNPDEMLVIIIA